LSCAIAKLALGFVTPFTPNPRFSEIATTGCALAGICRQKIQNKLSETTQVSARAESETVPT
jgi:hypothetical protein